MADHMTREQRHRCMSHIRSKDTRPELVVRRWLWAEGYRYRLHERRLPGTPDIVIRRLRTVIFVNGCFWHGHNVEADGTADGACGVTELRDSACCRVPHTRRDFWLQKIVRNRQRDYRNYARYQEYGWHVLVVWECMLKGAQAEATLRALSLRLNALFLTQVRRPKGYGAGGADGEPDAPALRAAEPACGYGAAGQADGAGEA